jgi:hypothetical protein
MAKGPCEESLITEAFRLLNELLEERKRRVAEIESMGGVVEEVEKGGDGLLREITGVGEWEKLQEGLEEMKGKGEEGQEEMGRGEEGGNLKE